MMKNINETIPSKNTQKIRVVVTDDEPINAMNLKEMLEDSGYDVVGTAGNGFEAIGLCKKFHPDVLLLDIKMPLLDGVAVSEYVHKHNMVDTVIIISAFNDESIISTVGENGVAGYLVKPVVEDTLISTIRIAMARSEEYRKLQAQMEKVMKDVENRKKIEQAKGWIMQKFSMSEQDAFSFIRSISKDSYLAMETVADIIIGIK